MTEETRFTPGPWRIGSLESYDAYTGKPFRNVWAGDPDADEAIVVARCIDNGNCNDDARLIAAAPCLYAALKEFEAWDIDVHATEADASRLRRQIGAAIRKAEGDGA